MKRSYEGGHGGRMVFPRIGRSSQDEEFLERDLEVIEGSSVSNPVTVSNDAAEVVEVPIESDDNANMFEMETSSVEENTIEDGDTTVLDNESEVNSDMCVYEEDEMSDAGLPEFDASIEGFVDWNHYYLGGPYITFDWK